MSCCGPFYQVDDPQLVEGTSDRSGENVTLSYNSGSEGNVEKALDAMQNAILGTETDYISDELIRNLEGGSNTFQEHDDSLERSIHPQEQYLVRTSVKEGTEKTDDFEEGDQNPLLSEAETDCLGERDKLEQNYSACALPNENQVSVSMNNEVGNMNIQLASYIDSCTYSRNWDNSSEEKDSLRNDESTNAIFETAEMCNEGVGIIIGEGTLSSTDGSDSLGEGGNISSPSNDPLFLSSSDETQTNQCFENVDSDEVEKEEPDPKLQIGQLALESLDRKSVKDNKSVEDNQQEEPPRLIEREKEAEDLQDEKDDENIENELKNNLYVEENSSESKECEIQSSLVLEEKIDDKRNEDPLRGEDPLNESAQDKIESGKEEVCKKVNNGGEELHKKDLSQEEISDESDTNDEGSGSKFSEKEQIQERHVPELEREGECPSREDFQAAGSTAVLERERVGLEDTVEHSGVKTCQAVQERGDNCEKQNVALLDGTEASALITGLDLGATEDKLNGTLDECVKGKDHIPNEKDMNKETTLDLQGSSSGEVGEGVEVQRTLEISTKGDIVNSVSGINEKLTSDSLSSYGVGKCPNVEETVKISEQNYQQESTVALENSELTMDTAEGHELLAKDGMENHVLSGVNKSLTAFNDNAKLLAQELSFTHDPIIVRSTRKSLTKEEVQFVKMGQIMACSVEIEKMKPELIKAYTFGRIKIRGSGKNIKRYLCIPSTLRLKIMKDLNFGKKTAEISSTYGISRSSVDRIRLKMKLKERKSLKLASHIGTESASNSKRALTFSTRVKIMGKLERGVSIEALSHEYGINKSTLKTLRRLKNEKMRERQNSSESSASQEGSESTAKEKNSVPVSPESGVPKKTKKMFTKPKCFLSVLLILILQNTETRSLSYIKLKKLLCYLFPSFCKELNAKTWTKNISGATTKRAKDYFLKSRIATGKVCQFGLSLKPEEEENWKKFVREGSRNLRNEAERVMRRPELLESLLLGIMRLDNWIIADEEIQPDSDEEGNSGHVSGKAQELVDKSSGVSSNEDRHNPGSNVAANSISSRISQSLEQSNILKRKNSSSMDIPYKFQKTVKDEGSSDSNQSSSAVSKSGMGQGICDTNVNNRLVNLLMGKEKHLSGKSKDTRKISKSSPVKNMSSKTTDVQKQKAENVNCSVKSEPRSSSQVLTSAETNKSLNQSNSKVQEASSLSFAHSSVSDQSGSPLREIRVPQVKLEVSPLSERSISPANEEDNLPRIISVEDRAYHMWQPKDQDDSVDMETRSESPEKNKSRKVYGKSVLSLVKKSESKTSSKRTQLESTVYGHAQHMIGPGDSNRINPAAQSSPGIAGVAHSQPGQSGLSISQSSQILQASSRPQLKYTPASDSHPHQARRGMFQPNPNPCIVESFPAPTNSNSLDSGSLQNQLRMPQSLTVAASSPCNIPMSMGPNFRVNNHSIQHGHAMTPQENMCSVPGNVDMGNWSSAHTDLTHSKSGKHGNAKSLGPKVSECIETWQKVFPWMYYVEDRRTFICSICEWSSSDPQDIEVFRLQTPKDVYLVAGQLRYHKETTLHRTVAYKREKVTELFDYVFPVLRGHLQEISRVEDIIKTVSDLAGGTFPGPQNSPQKEYFMTYMIKHIAECIEEKLFASLEESPFFSAIAVKDKDYAIIRWLNNRGESEEHFFCSQIGFPGQTMSCLAYLKKRNVNMNKMISYTTLSNLIETNIDNSVMLQVPVRYPPLSVCLEWLDKASFLKNLFQHLSVLTRLCKTSYHKFAQFPVASELMNMVEPYSHNCIVNSRIVNFFFGNIKVLRKIAQDIYKTTGNMEAYGFSVLELQDYDSLLRCSSLLTKLHSIMSAKHSDPDSLCKLMKDFRTRICQRLPELKRTNAKEYSVMSLIDIFLSHVMITLLSPGKEVTDIFSKSLKSLSSDDLEKMNPNLMSECKGTSAQCLAKLRSLGSQLGESHDISLLHLLSVIVSKQELAQMHPDLYRLYQKITVLPFLHAHVEQSMFSVAAAEVFLKNKLENRLLLPVTLILLEGQSIEHVEKSFILESWSRKWKVSKLHKDM
ncbi:major antigen-like [Palaemon carinicauda]|uniref:major antigen-like n=1 Tax=Palaemon carinicauda TaxID=392227 RepID=UPI0035B5B376